MQSAEQSQWLTAARLRLGVAVLIRNVSLFGTISPKLSVDCFEEDYYQLLYRAVLDHYNANQELPSKIELQTEISSLLEEDSELISDDSEELLIEFLDFAFSSEITDGFSGVSDPKLEKFAKKCFKVLASRQYLSTFSQQLQTVESYDMLYDLFGQAQKQIDYLNAGMQSSVQLAFEDDWDTHRYLKLKSCGLSFLDKYMSGGIAENEIYGFMAPYGTCKTTIGVQLWVHGAKHSYENSLSYPESARGLSIFISYEAPKQPEIIHRSLMCGALVSRYSLEAMGTKGRNNLSNDPYNPLPYEQKLFAQQISDQMFIPERQRVEQMISRYNPHMAVLDFSGTDKNNPGAGNGGVAEIREKISDLLNQYRDKFQANYHVDRIILDYHGLMIDRDATIPAKSRKEDHKLYQEGVIKLKNTVCNFFNCPMFLLHQLSGEANAYLAPGKKISHTDAKGSKSFAENLDFAFVVGNLNEAGLGVLHCSKHRRAKALKSTIIQVQGEFNLVTALDNYQLDSKGNIVDKQTANMAGSVDIKAYKTDENEEMIQGLADE